WRGATLVLDVVSLDPADGDVMQQLIERFDPEHCRLDVRQAPMLRLHAAHDAAGKRWLLVLLNHHLCGDHTTQDVMLREIRAFLLGEQRELPPPMPFRNFVAQARAGVTREEHEAYFRRLLGDVDEPTVPFGFSEIHGDGRAIATASQWVGTTLSIRLRDIARDLRVSAASLCHLAWAMVLARVSGRDDVVFGTLMFGRMQGGDGADQVMGLFINTLPVRIRIDETSALDGARQANALLVDLLRHEHAPLALAQRCSGVAAPAPLFTALLNYRHSGATHAPAEAMDVAFEGITSMASAERTDYPLVLNVDDVGDRFCLTLQVQSPIDPQQVCAQMHTALQRLVDALSAAPATPLCRLDVLPEAQRRLLLAQDCEAAGTSADMPFVHQRIEAQAARTPHAMAVVQHDGNALSYAALNERANRLARHLRGLGVRADARVAICMERSADLVVAMLAVLKAGGGYVPLDPGYPPQRLAFMVEDCAPAAVLTDGRLGALPARTDGPPIDVLDVRADAPHWADESGADLEAREIGLEPDHLAYVIYTSGSTGRPKAAQVLQRGLSNLMHWYVHDLGLGADDAVLVTSSHSFDLTQKNYFGPLMVGGTLHLAGEPFEPRAILQQVKARGITQLNMAPSAFHALADADDAQQLAGVRRVVLGGEPIQTAKLRQLPEPRPEFVNSYGPTECSDVVAFHRLDPALSGDTVPLGQPVRNVRLLVLDARGRPAPFGVAGEIHVGGIAVGRGYLHRPELTAERFVDDPFHGGRMYKTGDLGRWMPDGRLEFLGRNDFQVKIRGLRVELGEIEARLLQHPGIAETVVIARDDGSGDKRLVAYCVPAGEPVEAQALRAHLEAALPQHMVPAAWVMLAQLPLNPNGKIDRKALPAPEAGAYVARGYEPPQGEVECELARIWAQLLKIDRVGRNDHFFELGGHSLLAVSVIERMRRAGLHADVRTLFATPTLAALAQAVGAGGSEPVEVPPNGIPAGCTAITPQMLPLVTLSQAEIDRVVAGVPGGAANVQDIYPLAPLQEGILFHHLMETQGDVYLTPALLAFDTRERLDRFVGALQAVVDRHDILRTAMAWEGLREPVQVLWRVARLHLEEIALDAAGGDIGEQLLARFDPRHHRIDVRSAPLLRLVAAPDASRGGWVLLQLFHHLATDHTTVDLLHQEIQQHLQGRTAQLPPALPFRNFVAQARLGVPREEHEAFFREMLADVEEPTLPFGLADVHGDGCGIVEAFQPLDPALSRQLREAARSLGVSAASVCHLAWGQVLARLCGRDDVVFGTLLFGRMQGGEGADRVLGLFLNTLPLRVRIRDQDVRSALREVHARLTQLVRHEHASLALAQRCSGVAAPAPLFNSLLNYRHSGLGDASAIEEAQRSWQGIRHVGGEERTNYPVGLCVDDFGQDFALTAQVHASVDPQRICAFMQAALEGLVHALAQAPATKASVVDVLPTFEAMRLLHEWNATEVARAQGICAHDLFEAQVARTPEAVALVQGECSMSYEALNWRANRLARHLRTLGVGPDARVGICVQRGVDMVVGLLATLKAGGAYVPLDPTYPA
ncbi:MAG TPA: amino acid adenylation domain-containing protein, partial [Albitalea sp.]